MNVKQLDMHTCVKEALRAMRGLVHTSISKKSHSTYPETHACCDMGDVRVISTADALCGSHEFNITFSSW
jgi:hypothetical protein